ncbi:MAG: hypothetical protein U9Q07_05975, partial [Planctomycetota bacterium]|nr:hypothetical protein [Planctomycetota bacterium]
PVVPRRPRPQQSPTSRLGLRRHALDIGPEIYHFKYEEPGLMEEKGMFYGVRFGFTARDWVTASSRKSPPSGGGMFRAEGRLAFGRVDYDGMLAGGTPYKANGIDDFAGEGRLLLGRDWLTTGTLSTMYTGVGYRYLNDNLATDPAGYERESNYLYIPLGYNLDIGRDVGWSFGFGAEFDVFVFGRQESHLSDFNPALQDIDNHQTSGYGYRASVRLTHKSKAAIFTIEPFFRYWDIDKSHHDEIYDAFVEPANETTEWGIQLSWMF